MSGQFPDPRNMAKICWELSRRRIAAFSSVFHADPEPAFAARRQRQAPTLAMHRTEALLQDQQCQHHEPKPDLSGLSNFARQNVQGAGVMERWAAAAGSAILGSQVYNEGKSSRTAANAFGRF